MPVNQPPTPVPIFMFVPRVFDSSAFCTFRNESDRDLEGEFLPIAMSYPTVSILALAGGPP